MDIACKSYSMSDRRSLVSSSWKVKRILRLLAIKISACKQLSCVLMDSFERKRNLMIRWPMQEETSKGGVSSETKKKNMTGST